VDPESDFHPLSPELGQKRCSRPKSARCTTISFVHRKQNHEIVLTAHKTRTVAHSACHFLPNRCKSLINCWHDFTSSRPFNSQASQAGAAITEFLQPLLRAGGERQDVYYLRVSLEVLDQGTSSNEHSAFVAGGIAACGAVTATHPFETVKIR
jgi:hypothetical protein